MRLNPGRQAVLALAHLRSGARATTMIVQAILVRHHVEANRYER